jgi:cobalt-zinc-cadmium efflux system outer membrane protein
LLFTLGLFASTAHAQSLTEQEVVLRALAQPALLEITRARVAAEQSRAEASSARPNPQLNYTREQTYRSNGTSEDYGSLSQTIHLGGRYKLRREAGEARARAREQQGRAMQISIAADARERFYECLYRERRVATLREVLVRVEQTLTVVQRRLQKGDTTPYDELRVERERAAVAARSDTEQAYALAAKHRLAALLALDEPALLAPSGTILPEADPDRMHALRGYAARGPDLLALEQDQVAAQEEARAAASARVPELRIEAGYKGVELNNGARTDGFTAGGSLSLPLWDRGTHARRASKAEARALAAEKALLEQRLLGELNAARAQAAQLRATARAFGERSRSTSRELLRIASAGYEGGELSLLELLEVYRTAAEDELSVLDLELASRRAFIELQRLTGAGLP